ncbi:MAG: hypothetical protein FWE02_01775 [Defluviitaleaceae bacterium]|nr:hypothetical protein [Defluviitaleaceae bacterium]
MASVTGTLEGDLEKAAGRHPTFKCVEAAAAISSILERRNKRHEVIKIDFTNRGFVWSDSRDMLISQNGHHRGVLYNGLVRCNVHP